MDDALQHSAVCLSIKRSRLAMDGETDGREDLISTPNSTRLTQMPDCFAVRLSVCLADPDRILTNSTCQSDRSISNAIGDQVDWRIGGGGAGDDVAKLRSAASISCRLLRGR